MNEHIGMRVLLEEVRQELGVIFEHGLVQGGLQEQALRDMGRELGRSGLAHGEQLANRLAAQMAASRLDLNWQPQQAVADFSALWRYTGFCLRRLEFLEAKAVLTAQETDSKAKPMG